METEANAEAAVPSSDQAQRPEIDTMMASTDPRMALADIARQRAADKRRRHLKRAAQGLLVLGMLVAALTIPRFREHGRAAANPGDASAARRAGSAPLAPAPQASVPALEAEQDAVQEVAVPEEPSARCDGHFKAHQWRGAIESCSVAFDATPTPLLAMRLAHAHWAHGDAEGAGTWARNALELGTKDPDAYVLIGNSEEAAGKRRKAIAAYRQYLALAPRGWHAERLRPLVGRAPSTAAAQ